MMERFSTLTPHEALDAPTMVNVERANTASLVRDVAETAVYVRKEVCLGAAALLPTAGGIMIPSTTHVRERRADKPSGCM
jgi:hypothetical protein